MTTLDLHPWNFMPAEILARIFSFLPVRDRHNVSRLCKLWATVVSSASVWCFTEVHCDSEETDQEQEAVVGDTSSTFLQKIQPYMGHIRYLKLVLDMSLEMNRRLACILLEEMARESRRLEGIQIVCYGRSKVIFPWLGILQTLIQLFQGMDEASMQHIDFRKMPFILDNMFILEVARCCPNLRTLLINNHVAGITLPHNVVEVLRLCPKLSTLGLPYIALSRRMFQELLRPTREPFKTLEIFCAITYRSIDIPADCWTSVRERHPGFRVCLEFAANITNHEITWVLNPHMPISELHLNAFTDIATQVNLVTKLYAGTLEKLVLHSGPCADLNLALIQLAKACSRLKEIHCFCEVDLKVVEAFQCHCPHLEKYTLSPTMVFCDNPPTVILSLDEEPGMYFWDENTLE